MPHPDEIDYEYGGCAYVWTRPSKDSDWEKITGHWHDKGDAGWRPSKLTGYCDPANRGSPIDGRRVEIIGYPYAYLLHQFEFGDLLEAPVEPQFEASAPNHP